MPQERLIKQALLVKANGKRQMGRPRARWTIYIEDLEWNYLGLYQSKFGGLISRCCAPLQPPRKSGQLRERERDFLLSFNGHV